MYIRTRVIVILLAFLCGIQAIDEGLVSINQGTLIGIAEETLEGKSFFSFLGIPFAEPPVGSLRFKNPIPAEKWEGVFDATEEPEYCLQINMLNAMKNDGSEINGAEDCLYLSVYTSKPMQCDAKLPVIVFIHGGGFASGGSRDYKPYILLNEDIVLVVIQYRLGALGFLSAGDKELTGNYGLKDQSMALKWVKENILSFGGDPASVTLMGHSAGAISAHMHMFSPYSKGLFHSVIAQSGSALFLAHSNRTLRREAEKFGSWVGCSLEKGTDKYVSCLQEVKVEKLLKSASKFPVWGAVPSPLMAIVDGDFLPDDPINLIKEKKYNKADFMAGITKDEGIAILLMFYADENLLKILSDNFDEVGPISLYMEDENDASNVARAIYSHYLKGRQLGKESMQQLGELFTDRIFAVPHDLGTMLHVMDSDIKVYRYELHHVGKLTLGDFLNVPEAKGGVSHGDDLMYFFFGGPILNRPMEDPNDLEIRHFFTKMWTNFAKTGDPTPDDSLGYRWSPATSASFKHLEITIEPSMEEDKRGAARNFWLSLPLSRYSNIFDDLGQKIDTPQHKGEL